MNVFQIDMDIFLYISISKDNAQQFICLPGHEQGAEGVDVRGLEEGKLFEPRQEPFVPPPIEVLLGILVLLLLQILILFYYYS